MKAYKCDRCGKLFEGYDQNLNPTKDHSEDYVLKISKKGRYSNAHDKCFDLCPKCYKEFADFLMLKVESKEDKPHYVAESEDKE